MQRHTGLSSVEKTAQRAMMGIPFDALVIAITAQLELEKGLNISMESISQAVSSLPPVLRDRVRVIIAGDGQLREWLEEEIRHRELGHICRTLGNISSKEIHSLLVASDIALHLYTSTCGAYIPTGLLEGMAMGCAIIASTESLANTYVLSEGRGIVVPVGDVEQTCTALQCLLRDAELRNRLGKAAREYVALHHGTEALRTLLQQTSYWSDVGETSAIQTEPLATIEVDQIPTRVGLRAIPITPSWDGILIYNQPTWQLPVIPRLDAASIRALPSATQIPGGESYFGLIRNLIKNSGIYAISSLAAPLVTLLLAPFLTHTLSRTDYGALAVLNTVVALVTGVTELGLSAAFTRMYSADCKTRREQLDVLSTLVLLLLLILIPVMTIGVLAAPWLSALVLGSTAYSGAVLVAAVLVLTENLTVPGLVWLRVESRAALFSIIAIANLLITAGATIVLVGVLHMGVVGSLIANGLGDAIIIVCTLPIIFWRAGFHLRFAMVTSMLAFGVPNVMNLISGWVLQVSDRYLLGHLASLSLAAGYSVAYSLGGVLSSAIIAPFSLAWWTLMYSIAKREDAKQVFKLIFRGFSFVLLLATLGMSLFGSNVFDVLFPASYHAQTAIIPIIALSVMFNGIFIVVNLGTSLQRKTWLSSLYYICSALVNVALNIMLIPIFGTMGAALATLAAYIALVLIAYLFNRRIYPVPFEIGLFLLALGIGIALYLVSNSLAQGQSIVLVWGIHIGVLLLYGLCLSFLGWFSLVARITHSFIARL
ncbi:MAG: glycosyltransferase [Ktedonobacteraceae bacterium]